MNSESSQSYYNTLCNVFKRAFIVTSCEYGNLFIFLLEMCIKTYKNIYGFSYFFICRAYSQSRAFYIVILFSTGSNQRVLTLHLRRKRRHCLFYGRRQLQGLGFFLTAWQLHYKSDHYLYCPYLHSLNITQERRLQESGPKSITEVPLSPFS